MRTPPSDEEISKFSIIVDQIESLPLQEKSKLLDQIQHLVPTPVIAIADQIEAESRRIREVLSEPSEYHKVEQVAYHQNPTWVRLPALTTLLRWYAGKAKTCIHSPTPQEANMVLAAAWKPDLVVCQECDHMLRLRSGSEPDRTCDLCGHITAGRSEDPICSYIIQFGIMLYTFGACVSCAEDTMPVS